MSKPKYETFPSLALDSLEANTCRKPFRCATRVLTKASRAEKGVWPFKYPSPLSCSSCGSRAREDRSGAGYPAASIASSDAGIGFSTKLPSCRSFVPENRLSNSRVTTESLPPPTSTRKELRGEELPAPGTKVCGFESLIDTIDSSSEGGI